MPPILPIIAAASLSLFWSFAMVRVYNRLERFVFLLRGELKSALKSSLRLRSRAGMKMHQPDPKERFGLLLLGNAVEKACAQPHRTTFATPEVEICPRRELGQLRSNAAAGWSIRICRSKRDGVTV